MRKQKLRSSIKTIQEAIISIKPFNPTCIHQPRTNSFRDESTKLVKGSTSNFSPSTMSNRFFFSPCMTKSIMEEVEARTMVMDPDTKTAEDLSSRSIVVVLASDDPYIDFKLSMEEMVKTHGVREWVKLEELLLCYLRLNERRNHKDIVMAFVDLVKNLMGFPSHFVSEC